MDRRKALKKTGLLAGAAVAMPSLLSILQSCKTEQGLNWQPEFFTKPEAKTISSLIDFILPRTDTPGALDVNADVFIDKVIAQTYDEKGQQHMRNEISTFNEKCKENFGSVFSALNDSQKTELLQTAEKSSGKINRGVWGTAVGEQEAVGFYRAIKSMAIWAYFTSEEVGKKVLNYDPIPGKYDGCMPLSEIGSRWSL